MSDTGSSIISALGAGSGIDISSLASSLTEVAFSAKEERLDTRETDTQAQISAYGQLSSAFDELQAAVSTLADNDLYNARTVSVPSTEVITANSVDAGAQTGSYKIEVLEVASAQSLAMGSSSDEDSALGLSGSMTISLGTWEYDTDDNPSAFTVNDSKASFSIDIEEGDSLETIAEKINDQDAGVQASVVKVDDDYQLLLTSETGESNAMEITVDDASLNAFAFNASQYSEVNETQQASDARFKVNGLELTRESNDVDDAIDGFSFTINKAAEGEELTYAITAETDTAEEAIQDFVDAYNTFYETVNSLVGYTTDEEGETVRGDLASDSTARVMMQRLREAIGGLVPGVEDGYNALTNLGIRTELDGTLSIDEDELETALTDNFDLLEGLFATTATSSNPNITVGMGTYVSEVVAGSYEVVITQDPTKGDITTNAISDAGFDSASDTFATALDTSGGSYSFQISVDGVESELIELTGVYSSAEELRADLQSMINGDANLKDANVGVAVTYDEDTDSFTFTSQEYGSTSEVSFTSVSTDMQDLGFDTALTGTTGLDVAGTINGEEGFGAGDILLPGLDSDAYGMTFIVTEGAAAAGASQVQFSHGFAGELDNLIDNFNGSSGVIETRVEGLEEDLEEIDEDRTTLETRKESYLNRLLAQYTAMETILSTLSSTSDALDSLMSQLESTWSS